MIRFLSIFLLSTLAVLGQGTRTVMIYTNTGILNPGGRMPSGVYPNITQYATDEQDITSLNPTQGRFLVSLTQPVSGFWVWDDTSTGTPGDGVIQINGYAVGRWIRQFGGTTAPTLVGGRLLVTSGAKNAVESTTTSSEVEFAASNTLFPLPSGLTNYWALGTSQTYGLFVNSQTWTDGAKRMFSELRYPNIIATAYGLNLTNLGVSSSRLLFDNATTYGRSNILQQANVIIPPWTGVVTAEIGYNDSIPETYGNPSALHTTFRRATGAVIAKLLSDTYTGPSGVRYDGTTDSSFSTTGTVVDEGLAGMSPFPIGAPTTDTRKYVRLTGVQTITFAATNPAVWIESTAAITSGEVRLLKGTNWLDSANLASSDTTARGLAVLLGKGQSGTFTVTNVSGTNFVLAVGSIKSVSSAGSKFIAVAAPNRLASPNRKDQVGADIGKAIQAAASEWSDYNVYFADFSSKLDLSTMVPSNDPDHPDPRGHQVMATAFSTAAKAVQAVSTAAPVPLAAVNGIQIMGAQSTVANFYNSNSFTFQHVGGIGYADSQINGSYLPMYLRAKPVGITQSGLFVQGAFSGVSEYPIGSFAALSQSGGEIYLDGFTSDGTTATSKPISIRGKPTKVTGALLTSGTASSTNELPIGNYLIQAQSGGVVYIDANNFAGNVNPTYIPMELRAKPVRVSAGALLVQGSFASTAEYPVATFVATYQTGTQGYIGSFTWSGSAATYVPLHLQGLPVYVGESGYSFIVGGDGGNRGFSIVGGQNNIKYIDFRTGTGTTSTNRWRINSDSSTESGSSNAGSDLAFERYSDAGTLVSTPLKINRSTGELILGGGANVRLGSSTGPVITWGAGSPEGVAAFPIGSMYHRTDGGAGTSIYVKESGAATATGWVGK